MFKSVLAMILANKDARYVSKLAKYIRPPVSSIDLVLSVPEIPLSLIKEVAHSLDSSHSN